MSTRCSIVYDEHNFHLYQECFENDNVYLRLDGEGWDASLDTSTVDWRDGDAKRPSLTLRIDVSLWRRIAEGWAASPWGQDPSIDHRKDSWDPEAFNGWLESLNLKKKDEKENE
jgi:hypothetical protein